MYSFGWALVQGHLFWQSLSIKHSYFTMTLFLRLCIRSNACGSCVVLDALWKHHSFAGNITGLQIWKCQCFSLHYNDRHQTSFSNLMERLLFTSCLFRHVLLNNHQTNMPLNHCRRWLLQCCSVSWLSAN